MQQIKQIGCDTGGYTLTNEPLLKSAAVSFYFTWQVEPSIILGVAYRRR